MAHDETTVKIYCTECGKPMTYENISANLTRIEGIAKVDLTITCECGQMIGTFINVSGLTVY